MIGAVLGRGRRRGAGWRVGVAASILVASAVASIGAGAGTAVAATSVPADIDPGYGVSGLATQPYSSQGTGVAIVPAGVLDAADVGDTVVSGTGVPSPSVQVAQFQVARFTPAGAPDPTFGNSTGVVSSFAGQANAVTVIPSGPNAGEVLVAGVATGSACFGEEPVVAEYKSNGTLDTSFGTSGVAHLACTGPGSLNGVALDALGNIVVAGEMTPLFGTEQTLVARLFSTTSATTNGHLDTTFGSGGESSLAIGSGSTTGSSGSVANAVAISPTGHDDIVTTGTSYPANSSSTVLTVAAILPSGPNAGQLDTTFSCSTSTCISPAAGVVTSPQAGSIGYAVTVLPNGAITAAGSTTVGARTGSLLAQYGATGTPTAFGTGGQVVDIPALAPPNTTNSNELHALTYQPATNLLVAAGFASSGTTQDMLLAQYDATSGHLNPTFGTGGILQDPSTAGPSTLAEGVAVQGDGKTVAVGAVPSVNNATQMGAIRTLVPQVFVSVPRTRACDNRVGITGGIPGGCLKQPVKTGTPLLVPLPTTGPAAVPAGASAVVVNVTGTQSSAPAVATVYPAGQAAPSVANQNFPPGQAVSNLDTVAIGSSSGVPAIDVLLSNPGVSASVIVDVEGYYVPAGTAPTGTFNPVVPFRLADTRCSVKPRPAFCGSERLPGMNSSDGPIGPNRQDLVYVRGVGAGVPVGAAADSVVLNVTAINPTATGNVDVAPGGGTGPGGPTGPGNLNFAANGVVSNHVIVQLPPPGSPGAGAISVYNSFGTTNVTVDVEGWFSSASGPLGATFEPVSPIHLASPTVAGGQAATVSVAGAGGIVPSSIDAAVLNLTDNLPPAANYLFAYPSGHALPTGSDVGWAPADPFKIIRGAAYAMTGSNGAVSISNQPAQAGSTNIPVDLFGYYIPRTAAQ